jgi:citrate lyase subunit beta/citryl-CoA lyase
MDGVYNDFSDLAGFEQECVQGASMGMSGKTLIHPKQIAAANAAYSPSAEAIAQAQTIVDAFAKPENAGLGAIQVNGAMVERLHLDMAQHTLRIAQQLKTRS